MVHPRRDQVDPYLQSYEMRRLARLQDWAATELALLLVMEAIPSVTAEFYGRSVAAFWNSRTSGDRERKLWVRMLRRLARNPNYLHPSNIERAAERLGLPLNWMVLRQLVNAARKRQMPRSTPITEQEILSD